VTQLNKLQETRAALNERLAELASLQQGLAALRDRLAAEAVEQQRAAQELGQGLVGCEAAFGRVGLIGHGLGKELEELQLGLTSLNERLRTAPPPAVQEPPVYQQRAEIIQPVQPLNLHTQDQPAPVTRLPVTTQPPTQVEDPFLPSGVTTADQTVFINQNEKNNLGPFEDYGFGNVTGHPIQLQGTNMQQVGQQNPFEGGQSDQDYPFAQPQPQFSHQPPSMIIKNAYSNQQHGSMAMTSTYGQAQTQMRTNPNSTQMGLASQQQYISPRSHDQTQHNAQQPPPKTDILLDERPIPEDCDFF
jgi:hypothetical protein